GDGRVLVVHRVQRLVREQAAGSGRQGARDCDSLALAGRQLVGIRPPPVRELDRFQRFDRALLDRPVRHLRVAQLQGEDYVFEGVQAGQQSLLLEDERDLAAQAAQATPPPAVQPAPTDPELAVVRAELAVDQAQQGRLARPARACDLDSSPCPTVKLTDLSTGLRPYDFETPTSLTAGSATSSPFVPGRCLVAPIFCARTAFVPLPFWCARARPVVAGRLPTL